MESRFYLGNEGDQGESLAIYKTKEWHQIESLGTVLGKL